MHSIKEAFFYHKNKLRKKEVIEALSTHVYRSRCRVPEIIDQKRKEKGQVKLPTGKYAQKTRMRFLSIIYSIFEQHDSRILSPKLCETADYNWATQEIYTECGHLFGYKLKSAPEEEVEHLLNRKIMELNCFKPYDC